MSALPRVTKEPQNKAGFAVNPDADYWGPAIAEANAKGCRSVGVTLRARLELRRKALGEAVGTKAKAYAQAYVLVLEAELLACDRATNRYEAIARGDVRAVIDALGPKPAAPTAATGTRRR